MMEKIYYTIHNDDGPYVSARFFDNKEVAIFDQEHAVGDYGAMLGEFETENVIIPEAYYAQLVLENSSYLKRFIKKFFPNKLPEFEVGYINDDLYGVIFQGKLMYRCAPTSSDNFKTCSNGIQRIKNKFKRVKV